jgi:hypothetical protein
MMKWSLFILSALMLFSCEKHKQTDYQLKHLNLLYEPVPVGEKNLGAVWIYCEAPEYTLVADDDEGFTCVDDVARALVLLCRDYQQVADLELLDKIIGMTEFILHMQAENGYFYNFMLPDRSINKTHINSVATASFWTARAAWGLSELLLINEIKLAVLQQRSKTALDKLWSTLPAHCFQDTSTGNYAGLTLPKCLAETGADQASVLLLALDNYHRRYPGAKILNWMQLIGNQLIQMQQGPQHSFLSWKNYWHAWGNTQAYALLRAGKSTGNQEFIDAAILEVEHFYPYVVENNFIQGMTLSRQKDSTQIDTSSYFPQIAYNISPMILAAIEAYAVTGRKAYAATAIDLATWYWGNNPARKKMYHAASGRTFDGITAPSAVNLNAGAESSIETLLCLQALHRYPKILEALNKKIR